MLPSADRATSASAPSSTATRSFVVTRLSWSRMAPKDSVLSSKTCDARLDGRRHEVQLGRRHHELHVRRRLFDGLEQRVERALRQPVDLVDDEDLEAVAHGRDRQGLDDDLPDGVDAGVGGAVNLEDVNVAAFGNFNDTRRTRRTARASAPSRSSAPAPGCARSSSCPRRAGPRR